MYDEKLENAIKYADNELKTDAPKIEGTLGEENLRSGYVEKVMEATSCDRNAAITALRACEKTLMAKV